jgi:hypothetical protein
MCNERERLIGYVYDECDDGERRAIEGHLETCGTCRIEIAGFRRLRQDLLAWDVPDHDSVWRPFAPARIAPWWREVPGWALAAAAVAMFAVGAGGGVVTHALVPHESPAVVTAEAASTPTEVTAADLAAFESRMLGLMQTQVATNGAAPGVQRVSMTPQERAAFEAEIMQRLLALQAEAAQQHDATWGVLAREFTQQTTRLNKLSDRVDGIEVFVQGTGFQGR